MKIKSFISDNIIFDENNHFNTSTKFFHSLGNLLLSPARHLWKGKTVTCVLVETDPNFISPLFGKIDDRHPKGLERACKTIISILLFIPGTILGSTIKGLTMITSPKLTGRYDSLENWEDALKNSSVRAAADVAICLYKRDADELFRILKNLKDIGQLEDFVQFFSSTGNYAFLEEFPNLYPTLGNNRFLDPDRPLNHLLGCFLKLFADERFRICDFFARMEELNSYARTFDYSGMQKPLDPIQERINPKDPLLTKITRIEEYLSKKSFTQWFRS